MGEFKVTKLQFRSVIYMFNLKREKVKKNIFLTLSIISAFIFIVGVMCTIMGEDSPVKFIINKKRSKERFLSRNYLLFNLTHPALLPISCTFSIALLKSKYISFKADLCHFLLCKAKFANSNSYFALFAFFFTL